MAYTFLRAERDQPFLLPPDLRDWLPEGHLAWFVLDVSTSSTWPRSTEPTATTGTATRPTTQDPARRPAVRLRHRGAVLPPDRTPLQ